MTVGDTIWQYVTTCDTMFHSVTICDSVWQRVTVWDTIWQCVTMCNTMFHSVTICDSVWQCVTVWDTIWQCVTMCDTMCHSVTIYDNVWHCDRCDTCKKTHSQHLLVKCDNCCQYHHLSCLDPPLLRMPKKTKQQGWSVLLTYCLSLPLILLVSLATVTVNPLTLSVRFLDMLVWTCWTKRW